MQHRCGGGEFLSQKRLAEISIASSLLRDSIRHITRHLKSLEPGHFASLVRLQVAANNDAEFRAKTWREKLKSNLFAKLSLCEQPRAPALKPRDADEVRAAILGDIYTEELRQKDSSASARRAVVQVSDKQRSMRIFYATTNTDAPLERDAVSARTMPPRLMECFPATKTSASSSTMSLIASDYLLRAPRRPSHCAPLRHRSVFHRRETFSLFTACFRS
jgi:hypothetical protein